HFDVLLHDVVIELPTDQALDSEQCVLGVGHGLAFGRLTHQGLTVLGERNDGRRGAIPFRILDYASLTTFQHCYPGVGGPQVYPDNFTHCVISISPIRLAMPRKISFSK